MVSREAGPDEGTAPGMRGYNCAAVSAPIAVRPSPGNTDNAQDWPQVGFVPLPSVLSVVRPSGNDMMYLYLVRVLERD